MAAAIHCVCVCVCVSWAIFSSCGDKRKSSVTHTKDFYFNKIHQIHHIWRFFIFLFFILKF
jgi:hypothetical protein